MALQSDINIVRSYISDSIEPYTFLDTEISNVIDAQAGDLKASAREFWLRKAAKSADLTDISESGSSRALSKLYSQALAMADTFAPPAVSSSDRPSIGRIVRP